MKDRRSFRFALIAIQVVLVAATAHLVNASSALAGDFAPRPAAIKPAHTNVDDRYYQDRISVKFNDNLNIRARNGSLTDFNTGILNAAQPTLQLLRGGQWRPTHQISEAKLAQLQNKAQANLNKQVADLNTQFDLILPRNLKPGRAIDLLNALDIVEIALPVPLPVEPPLPPDFQTAQGYLKFAPGGIDAIGVWTNYSTTGENIKIADIEYSWNLNHQDLPPATLIGPAPVDPFNNNNHGTAVLGELASFANGWGSTGVAYNSQLFVVAANTASGGYNLASAITNALTVLGPGDILLIEQQMVGPNGGQSYVPVEWYLPTYNAIVTAVGNGVTVIEPAGNGNQNLDDAIFSTGNGGHWPFLPQNDSGAFIVGAGAAYQIGSDVDRSRLSFSTYGSTVDLQGWGEQVVTTGYGTFYASEGVNLYYTSTFNGTSSASPMVAGAAALLQSRKKAFSVDPFTPAEVKNWLTLTGSPQQDGNNPASQHIGPRPNVSSAILGAGLVITNDSCSQATAIGAGSYGFSNAGASTDGPDEPGSCATGGFTQIENDVWFKFLAQCTGTATVDLCGANFDTKLAIYVGCPSSPGGVIVCNDDFCGVASQVSWQVSAGTVYRIRIGGVNGSMGGGTMVITCGVPTPCPADTNGDTQVNVTDLLAVINSWGSCPAPPASCAADVSPTGGDGQVNVNDLLAVINAWGGCP